MAKSGKKTDKDDKAEKATESVSLNFELYQLPEGHPKNTLVRNRRGEVEKEVRVWSFRVNGKESHYYGPQQSIIKRMTLLQKGQSPEEGRVRLRVVRSAGSKGGGKGEEKSVSLHWSEHKTLEERLGALLNRGRLVNGELPVSEDK